MIIDVKANLKITKGGLMRKGRYNDENEPFPQEIYDEIGDTKEGKTNNRGTIEVLVGSAPKEVEPESTTLVDPGDGVTKTGIEADLEKETELKEDVVIAIPPKKVKTRTRKK